ncbi:MAG: response regulator [Spirochaetes bacterium]|nr:response regulator [Spirochaetota bacterium]
MKSKHDFPSLNSKKPDGLKPSGKPYTVIVTDAHEFVRKQIKQILESEGYKIIAEAKNGREALELIDDYKDVDLVTTELDMPELDGYALLFELSQKERKPKVVFICEDTTKGVLQDLLKMGASDIILKPIQRAKLLERIKLAARK